MKMPFQGSYPFARAALKPGAAPIRYCAAVLVMALGLAACVSDTKMGGGSSVVSGSAGSAGAQGASTQLQRCTAPLGTAALVEPDAQASALLQQVGLQSPVPLLRLMMAQSNCFTVVDRGAALSNIETEDRLANSGMLRQGSTTARGRMITTQYLMTPNVIFSNPNAGGGNALGALGGFLGTPGYLAGTLAGSIRIQEAQTALFLTDAQSGVQTAVSEGSASVTDFGGAAGLGGWGGGMAGFGAISGYSNTAEGKLIAAALMDAYNNLVVQVRASNPNLPTNMSGSQAERGNAALVRAIQTELKRRGYYDSSIDGIYGIGTNAAISDYQLDNNLAVDGQPTQMLLDHLRAS